SLAAARAFAQAQDLPLYNYLHNELKQLISDKAGLLSQLKIELPWARQMNVINGGAHAGWNLDLQEFMIVAVPKPGMIYHQRYLRQVEVFYALKRILIEEGKLTGVGDEGGFSPKFSSHQEALEFIVRAIKRAGYEPGKDIVICLDPAASEFFKDGKYHLKSEGREFTPEEMVEYYAQLVKRYPIYSIEDGMAEGDEEGWKLITQAAMHWDNLAIQTLKELGLIDEFQTVGDDLFVTNKKIFMEKGIKKDIANAILIKVNQIGSVSETLDTIKLALINGYRPVVSHRSGESEDDFIADLVVALGGVLGGGQLKTGASRGERVIKDLRLFDIELELGLKDILLVKAEKGIRSSSPVKEGEDEARGYIKEKRAAKESSSPIGSKSINSKAMLDRLGLFMWGQNSVEISDIKESFEELNEGDRDVLFSYLRKIYDKVLSSANIDSFMSELVQEEIKFAEDIYLNLKRIIAVCKDVVYIPLRFGAVIKISKSDIGVSTNQGNTIRFIEKEGLFLDFVDFKSYLLLFRKINPDIPVVIDLCAGDGYRTLKFYKHLYKNRDVFIIAADIDATKIRKGLVKSLDVTFIKQNYANFSCEFGAFRRTEEGLFGHICFMFPQPPTDAYDFKRPGGLGDAINEAKFCLVKGGTLEVITELSSGLRRFLLEMRFQEIGYFNVPRYAWTEKGNSSPITTKNDIRGDIQRIALEVRAANPGLCQEHSAFLVKGLTEIGIWCRLMEIDYGILTFVETKDFYVDCFPGGYPLAGKVARSLDKRILVFAKEEQPQPHRPNEIMLIKKYKEATPVFYALYLRWAKLEVKDDKGDGLVAIFKELEEKLKNKTNNVLSSPISEKPIFILSEKKALSSARPIDKPSSSPMSIEVRTGASYSVEKSVKGKIVRASETPKDIEKEKIEKILALRIFGIFIKGIGDVNFDHLGLFAKARALVQTPLSKFLREALEYMVDDLFETDFRADLVKLFDSVPGKGRFSAYKIGGRSLLDIIEENLRKPNIFLLVHEDVQDKSSKIAKEQEKINRAIKDIMSREKERLDTAINTIKRRLYRAWDGPAFASMKKGGIEEWKNVIETYTEKLKEKLEKSQGQWAEQVLIDFKEEKFITRIKLCDEKIKQMIESGMHKDTATKASYEQMIKMVSDMREFLDVFEDILQELVLQFEYSTRLLQNILRDRVEKKFRRLLRIVEKLLLRLKNKYNYNEEERFSVVLLKIIEVFLKEARGNLSKALVRDRGHVSYRYTLFEESIFPALKILEEQQDSSQLSYADELLELLGEYFTKIEGIKKKDHKDYILDRKRLLFEYIADYLIEEVEFDLKFDGKEDIVLVLDYIPTPIQFARLFDIYGKHLKAIVNTKGCLQNHYVLAAESFGIPILILEGEDFLKYLVDGQEVLIFDDGTIVVSASGDTQEEFIIRRKEGRKIGYWCRDIARKSLYELAGIDSFVFANADTDILIEKAIKDYAQGIGLIRTENLFTHIFIPSLKELTTIFRNIVKAAGSHEVVLRIVDFQPDKKPLPFQFLYYKGKEWWKDHPLGQAVAIQQLRALIRLHREGIINFKVEFPMVESIKDYLKIEKLVKEAMYREGAQKNILSLGIMVETKQAVEDIKNLSKKEILGDTIRFIGIGTNDLTQLYYEEADRSDPQSASYKEYYGCLRPLILKKIMEVELNAKDKGVEVSLCGDLADKRR
ncbi:hypothetical protein HQ550_03920, partial [bacterium]|nr:hypothetical protein [bacterium]